MIVQSCTASEWSPAHCARKQRVGHFVCVSIICIILWEFYNITFFCQKINLKFMCVTCVCCVSMTLGLSAPILGLQTLVNAGGLIVNAARSLKILCGGCVNQLMQSEAWSRNMRDWRSIRGLFERSYQCRVLIKALDFLTLITIYIIPISIMFDSSILYA